MTCSMKIATKRQGNTSGFESFLNRLNENKFGFTLRRIKKALRLLGEPQNSFDVIHCAGSNGKGSVCSYLSCVLAEHGIKTGLYTSPHLKHPRERIKINNRDISAGFFAGEGLKLRRKLSSAGIKLTYFEFMTALAFCIFRGENIRTAVIETGLGGRLDATNADYKNKKLSVLTSVSLEHTEYLGNTRKKILLEKEKIIGRGYCVHNLRDKKLAALLEKLRPGKIYDAARMVSMEDAEAGDGGCSAYFGFRGGMRVRTVMREPVQLENIRTVLAVLKVLEVQGYVFSAAKVKRGILNTRVRGRLELKNGVYISTAHNPEAFEKLFEALDAIPGGKQAVVVFSILADKDVKRMLETVAARPGITLVLTQIDSPRALAVEKLEEFVVKCGIKYVTEPDNFRALKTARRIAGGGVVVVAGSFYLAGRFS